MGNASRLFERKVQELVQKNYNKVEPKITFVSKPILSLELKDLISLLNKSCIIYKINCFCEKSYIGQTSRHLKIRLNEHIPKCILKFIDEKTKIKMKVVVNAIKRWSIAEHLVKNTNCANNYDSSRFKILNNCTDSIDLVRMEAISIFLNKPELCKQKEFDYKVSLFV